MGKTQAMVGVRSWKAWTAAVVASLVAGCGPTAGDDDDDDDDGDAPGTDSSDPDDGDMWTMGQCR